MVNKIYYIADFSLPNMSAYALHVLKMCDALCEENNEVTLIIPHIDKKYKFEIIKNDFLLKKKFKIKTFFRSKKKLNFLSRIIFSFYVYNYLIRIKNIKLIISRSIISSIILSIFGEKNLLEIHTQQTSLTFFLINIVKLHLLRNNIKFIFLNENLRKIFFVKRNNSLILNDAVDIRDFNIKNIKRKKSCVYTGSFVSGKGVETIAKIAIKATNVNFYLYGNIKTLPKKYLYLKKEKNIFFKGFTKYKNIPRILSTHKILLMPYGKKVGVLAKNIDVANYFSPLKMFDYLASGGVIIASDLNVYKKILTNQNSIKIKTKKIEEWLNKINLVLETNRFNYLGKNSKIDAKNFTWEKRVNKILRFVK